LGWNGKKRTVGKLPYLICLGRTFAGDHELDMPLIAEPVQ
jgi:hypothetical protein